MQKPFHYIPNKPIFPPLQERQSLMSSLSLMSSSQSLSVMGGLMGSSKGSSKTN
jgi:hypothetical protein